MCKSFFIFQNLCKSAIFAVYFVKNFSLDFFACCAILAFVAIVRKTRFSQMLKGDKMDEAVRRQILTAAWKFFCQAKTVGNAAEAVAEALPMLFKNVYYFRMADLYARQAADLQGIKITQVRKALQGLGLFWRYCRANGKAYRLSCFFADGAAAILRDGER